MCCNHFDLGSGPDGLTTVQATGSDKQGLHYMLNMSREGHLPHIELASTSKSSHHHDRCKTNSTFLGQISCSKVQPTTHFLRYLISLLCVTNGLLYWNLLPYQHKNKVCQIWQGDGNAYITAYRNHTDAMRDISSVVPRRPSLYLYLREDQNVSKIATHD